MIDTSKTKLRNLGLIFGTALILMGFAYNIYGWLTSTRTEYDLHFIGLLLILLATFIGRDRFSGAS